MAVAAQFNVDAPRVADLLQRTHHLAEVDFSSAEQEVVVDAAAHILNVDVPESFTPAPQLVCNGDFSQAMQMAYVDCEAEEGMIHAPRSSA